MTRRSGPSFGSQVALECRATVGDQVLYARQVVAKEVWDDPVARKAIEENMRFKLVMEILKKWTPVIRVVDES